MSAARQAVGTARASVAVGLALAFAMMVGTTNVHAHDPDQPVACSDCHTCEQPTKARPCLKEGACARHEAMVDMDPDMGPTLTSLDALANLYEPVLFDHLAHAGMVRFQGGCESCHHFTPPDNPHPGCKDCHPASIEHEDIAQPGLKGAYHRSCMNCHTEWDNDVSCEVCHAKKKRPGALPDVEHKHYEPVTLDEIIIFRTEYEDGDEVPFHHLNHSGLYERDCSECHQEQSCKRCHVQGQELHPMGEPEATDLHDTCFRCHHEERCEDCHGRDPEDLFSHASTGWPMASYHEGLHCRSCHGERGPFLELEPRCANCHPDGWNPATFDHDVTGVLLDEVHLDADCEDCHGGEFGAGADCSGCHDDDRSYDQGVGFQDPGSID